MDNRGDLISLIGTYGKAVVDSSKTPDDRIAAMRAIEDFCDAAILAEREACAVIADGIEQETQSISYSSSQENYFTGKAYAADLIRDAIRARPAP